jgi:hypothetical protein
LILKRIMGEGERGKSGERGYQIISGGAILQG